MAPETNTPILRLVGYIQVGGAKWDMGWFERAYAGLAGTPNRGCLTRHVGYECYAAHEVRVRFLGVEVERIGPIPPGMLAWDISGDTWTVAEPVDGRDTAVWQGDIEWGWWSNSASGRTIGEFTAICPGDWTGDSLPKELEFKLTTNSYFAPDRADFDDSIELVDYDPSWPGQYQEFAAWLQHELGPDIALRIEHYGSTSIPGMLAKPVIDVLVEVPSFDQARMRALPIFNRLDFDYWWYNGHLCFAKRNGFMGVRTHHIHLAPANHQIWEGIAFRDYLRTHPDDAERYAALKRLLARSFRTDRERYTAAKADLVREITDKALQDS